MPGAFFSRVFLDKLRLFSPCLVGALPGFHFPSWWSLSQAPPTHRSTWQSVWGRAAFLLVAAPSLRVEVPLMGTMFCAACRVCSSAVPCAPRARDSLVPHERPGVRQPGVSPHQPWNSSLVRATWLGRVFVLSSLSNLFPG